MTKTNASHRVLLAVILIGLLSLSGCFTPTVITDLQIALDAISAALPVLTNLAGIPSATATAVLAYITATNQALGQASTILSGAGTDAEKAAEITAAFANIAVPVVPGQYAALVSLVATVAADVASFLASVPGKTSAAAKLSATHTTLWSAADRLRLQHCQSTANENALKLGKLHP
jgi:hypothetical protein